MHVSWQFVWEAASLALGLPGRVIGGLECRGVRRRGKYLLIDLDRGFCSFTWGCLAACDFPVVSQSRVNTITGIYRPRRARFACTTRAVSELLFMPGRRSPVAKKLLGGLGMEPLGPSFSCRLFIRASKPVAYPSSNYCWRGSWWWALAIFMHPRRFILRESVPRFGHPLWGLCVSSGCIKPIGQVLGKAIELGGSSLKDFSSADGSSGHFQNAVQVYGRAGLPCYVCGTP